MALDAGVLSQRALRGLKTYQYQAGGYTWLDDAHQPFWNCEPLAVSRRAFSVSASHHKQTGTRWACFQPTHWRPSRALHLACAVCVSRLPMWLAPNLITLAGTLAIVAAYALNVYYNPSFTGEQPACSHTTSQASAHNAPSLRGGRARRLPPHAPPRRGAGPEPHTPRRAAPQACLRRAAPARVCIVAVSRGGAGVGVRGDLRVGGHLCQPGLHGREAGAAHGQQLAAGAAVRPRLRRAGAAHDAGQHRLLAGRGLWVEDGGGMPRGECACVLRQGVWGAGGRWRRDASG